MEKAATYVPHGGNVKIESRKLDFKSKARPKTDTGLVYIEDDDDEEEEDYNSSQNVSSITLDEILDERARELYTEGHRRQDRIRFGMFTSGSYLWQFKFGSQFGTYRIDGEKYDLYPLPGADLNANPNLRQNHC